MTIYETLTQRVEVLPEEGEDEQTFLGRLVRAVNKLDEDEFEKLPEDAQQWMNDAVEAIEVKKPIQMCPGAPFANGHDAEAEAEAPKKEAAPKTGSGKKGGGKGAAKPASGKKAAAATKGAGGKKGASTAAKTAEKTTPKPKAAKAPAAKRAAGVLDHLMEEALADPKATPSVLKERVEAKHGIEVKEANAIGIRQQFRRFVRFFQSKGHLDHIKFD